MMEQSKEGPDAFLQAIRLSDAGTLLAAVSRLNKLLSRIEKPVYIVNIAVATESEFDDIVEHIAEYFSVGEIQKTEIPIAVHPAEMLTILDKCTAELTLVVDKKSFPAVSSGTGLDQTMHSHDQALKDGRIQKEMRTISQETGKRIILVRFCDVSKVDQMKIHSGMNDFAELQCSVISNA